MKIAYLIIAHTKPLQLTRLIKRLCTPSTWFFIHLDSKVPFTNMFSDILKEVPNTSFIKHRADIRWGSFSVVQAILNSLKEIFDSGMIFDYIVLMSGCDYPIKDNTYIFSYFKKNYGREFIHYRPLPISEYPEGRMDRVWYYYDFSNFHSESGSPGNAIYEYEMRSRGIKRKFIDGMNPYHGSMWWCLSWNCIKYILNLIDSEKDIINYFRYTKIPDEQFFQTLVMNSPFAEKAPCTNLWYLNWSIPNSFHPKTLDMSDFTAVKVSGALYARKFNYEISSGLMDTIDHKLL